MLKIIQSMLILLITNTVSGSPQSAAKHTSSILNKLHAIELQHHLKIGLYALGTNDGRIIAYHAQDRFPFESTCKFIGVAALLASNGSLLHKKVVMQPQELLSWHPISGLYVNQPVELQTLAEGAVSYSDNTAINTIIHELGGLQAVNQFARNIGNSSFSLNHYEINLNSNPKKPADTSTPQDMALSVQKILLGTVLNQKNKALLRGWMRNNTTGYTRMRAGVPLGWAVAEKTGSGSYGVANDIGIAWSPACKPVVLAIFTAGDKRDAIRSDEAIAQITRAVFGEFAPYDKCYEAAGLN